MRAAMIGLVFASILVTAGHAQDSPTVVELFTSQGCSSCPPADAFLTDLARQRRDVLALAFHVTYWDTSGWKDPFSLEAATARQRDYARELGDDNGVYTPQMVVDGTTGFVGSSRAQGLSVIAGAARSQIPVSLVRDGKALRVEVGTGVGQAKVLLVGFDPMHQTHIGRGENTGRTLLESNIVRSLTRIGAWSGASLDLHPQTQTGQSFAVLLQADNGRIIGAARLQS
ncbi:DUF1223 domain-containing protein [Rhodopila sp.]|uniref:DUF1223 domain-containing protein n=1 Tax=Rhodopila sp. TaxID=2480087 RepID=UPI003D138DDC